MVYRCESKHSWTPRGQIEAKEGGGNGGNRLVEEKAITIPNIELEKQLQNIV